MKWKAVLFDLDGTLVETSPEIADAVNDTLRHFALPEVNQAQVDGWIGNLVCIARFGLSFGRGDQ